MPDFGASLFTAIGSGLSAIGGGSAAAGAAAIGGLAAAGAGIASAVKGAPEPKMIGALSEDRVQQEKANERRRSQLRRGYRSTIIAGLQNQYGGGLKTTLGG
jgi:hypothetical protein